MKNINLKEIKKTIGENTEKLEKQTKQLWTNHSHYYTNLEPYQRGLILLGILLFLALSIYYLTHENPEQKEKRNLKNEAQLEEKLLKRMELLKKLRD